MNFDRRAALALLISSCWSCSPNVALRGSVGHEALIFGPVITLGRAEGNPSTPFLRFAPDGRLFAVWTEDHKSPGPPAKHAAADHRMRGARAPAPMRNAMIAWSSDGGKAWSPARRINSDVEAVQGEENGPKIAFDSSSRARVVWSVPGSKGDRTRANIRFAVEDGKGGFTAARRLNEIEDAARFPVIEAMPDGTFLIAWIDRRIDNPEPRQLYLMKMDSAGRALTENYPAGLGLCECCKLGFAFADDGKTVYVVDREVDANKIRNHVLRKSTDGAASFGAPVEIATDGWQVPSCPHSGPSIGRDSRGRLHVSWFTMGRRENEAGIYYSVSKDDGRSFAPRRLVQANTAPEILYNSLAVGPDDTVYLAWTNLDGAARSQVFIRAISGEGTWSKVRQISNAKGNASRPVLAVNSAAVHVAWTETDGEESRVVLRTAKVRQ